MALKALLLRKRIDAKKKALEALRAKGEELETRQAELAQAIEETETDEQRAEVEEMVTAFDGEQAQHAEAVENLEREIGELENQLEAEEAAQSTAPPAQPADNLPPAETNRGRSETNMITREQIPGMNLRERLQGIVTREDSIEFLSTVRQAISEKRAISNVGVLIPDVYLNLIRTEVARNSRLLPYVRLVSVSGDAKQPIMGSIPEAVWTECCGALNAVDLGFNQIMVECNKVGAYIAVCNATLEDSDIALAAEIVSALGTSIAKALDKAILFGTGVNMPLGIVTRLAQTSQPADWGALAPTWTDLHTSNIQKINIDGTTGAAFFTSLIEKLAIAKPKDQTNADSLVWVMNRKTHLHVMAKALAFDSSAALVANTTLMPIIGGTVIEFEDTEISDNEIIGGYFKNYLMAERAGMRVASSDIPLFLQEQTVFKASARYDGKPVFGEAFVIVNFANTDPTTSKTFQEDYANTGLNDLVITAAAGGTAGKTVLTVSNTVAESNPVLKYKLGVIPVEAGDKITGWTDLTSGTTAITAAAGKHISVVELDASGRAVSFGDVVSVPRTT